MTAAALIAVITSVAGGVLISRAADRHPWWGQWWYAASTAVGVVLAAVAAAQRDWGRSLWFAFCAALLGWSWWNCRKRRKRRKAAALMGAKSRARIQALARKARQAGTPRRVLRPVPGGTP